MTAKFGRVGKGCKISTFGKRLFSVPSITLSSILQISLKIHLQFLKILFRERKMYRFTVSSS